MPGFDQHTLTCAWRAINALGGAPLNRDERYYNAAIGDALDVLEHLGAEPYLAAEPAPVFLRHYGIAAEAAE